MKIHLITVGQKVPTWIADGYAEYAKRLPRECSLHLIEITLSKRVKNKTIAQCIQEESNLMLAKIPARSHIIALDEHGDIWDTLSLAKQLQQWKMSGSDISLLVGGPDGLSGECLSAAKQTWSLSRLTLPHPLVRVIVAEQLYRAWSIAAGHPYHRS